MNTFLLLSMISSSLCLPSDRVKGLLARIPNSCSTRTGDSCVFPFTYKGVEHYHCTYADSPTSWCATLTDSQGVVVTNRWGDCDTSALSSCQEEVISVPSCTTTSGPYPSQPCVFPFRYNGVTYSSCTTQDKSAAWCSTNSTLAGTHIPGYFGYCPSSCPGAETSSCTPGTSYNYNNLLPIIHLHHSLWPCYRRCLCLPLHLLWDHLRVLYRVDLRGGEPGQQVVLHQGGQPGGSC